MPISAAYRPDPVFMRLGPDFADPVAAAEFPQTWLRPANPVDRFNGLFPDTPAKLEAEREGKPYFPRR